MTDGYLSTVRTQLKMAIDFMGNTPDPDPHHTADWWIGDMPAYPDLYEPDDWEEMNTPIRRVWGDYIRYLEREEEPILDAYAECARQLERRYLKELMEA